MFLDRHMNILEQKEIENLIDNVDIPETNNKNCIKTVELITTTFGVKSTVFKIFNIKLIKK